MTCGGGRGGTLQCEDQVEERTAGRGGRGVVAVPDGASGTSLCCALVGEGFRTQALAPSRFKPIPQAFPAMPLLALGGVGARENAVHNSSVSCLRHSLSPCPTKPIASISYQTEPVAQ